jgi:hypothetical protein
VYSLPQHTQPVFQTDNSPEPAVTRVRMNT